jgi:hypothetical protein
MNTTGEQAAAQMAQERVVETLTYPVTGDVEVDCITAVLAGLHALQKPKIAWDWEALLSTRVRILEYVLTRERDKLARVWESRKLEAGRTAVPWEDQLTKAIRPSPLHPPPQQAPYAPPLGSISGIANLTPGIGSLTPETAPDSQTLPQWIQEHLKG